MQKHTVASTLKPTDHLRSQRSSRKQLAWGHEPAMHKILNLQLSANFTGARLQINFLNFRIKRFNLKRPINKMQAAGSRKKKFQRFGFDDTIRGACACESRVHFQIILFLAWSMILRRVIILLIINEMKQWSLPLSVFKELIFTSAE